MKQLLKKQIRTVGNRFRYGANAPEFAELIYVDPMQVNDYSFAWKQKDSGRIAGGDWDQLQNLIQIDTRFKYKACVERWELNKCWEETGIYEFMLDNIQRQGSPFDKCSSLEDIMARYARLDKLFEEVKVTGRFKTQQELAPGCYNEEGGVYVHIGRQNQLIFGGGGIHRLAIAKILRLNSIPAQLGVVHPEALASWKTYKQKPASHLTLIK